MPVEVCLKFEEKCYGVGTKLKFYPNGNTFSSMIGVIEKFTNQWMLIRGEDGYLYEISTMPRSKYHINPIIEIIEPVYYEEPEEIVNNRIYPSEGDIDIGWVWYIIIMLVGLIFKDRWLIWIISTIIFFLWKNGFLSGGKK